MSYRDARDLANEAAKDANAAKNLTDDADTQRLALAVNKLSLAVAALADQMYKDE
ncbi:MULTISPECIES: hypothetical protein [Microbacterium]|uniref:hypothetical protein n=1 Tax=Microbacterium TaxID=33882 RepID=UPI001C2C30C9|nr:hypothetical protein [Microbacterium paraoxydans]QXE28938.1 hypothetical protein IZR02_11105 [Microbacterium paraoxydans]